MFFRKVPKPILPTQPCFADRGSVEVGVRLYIHACASQHCVWLWLPRVGVARSPVKRVREFSRRKGRMSVGHGITSFTVRQCSGFEHAVSPEVANHFAEGPTNMVPAGPNRGPSERRLSAEGADLHLRRSSMCGRQTGVVYGSPSGQASDSSWS